MKEIKNREKHLYFMDVLHFVTCSSKLLVHNRIVFNFYLILWTVGWKILGFLRTLWGHDPDKICFEWGATHINMVIFLWKTTSQSLCYKGTVILILFFYYISDFAQTFVKTNGFMWKNNVFNKVWPYHQLVFLLKLCFVFLINYTEKNPILLENHHFALFAKNKIIVSGLLNGNKGVQKFKLKTNKTAW